MGNKCKIFKKGNRQLGITLVALVVTVAVLLILAGVSIRLVLDNNEIITKAGDAKDKHEQGRVNDQTDLDTAEDYINQMTGGGTGTGLLPTNADGSSKPYLPSSDFTQVGGTTLDNGLVIQDGDENQYVWIEVPKTETIYGKDNLNITEFSNTELNTIKEKLIAYASDYRDNYSDTWYDGCGRSPENYPILYNKMLKSVYQNGGFWIGRYEIGDENATSTNTGRTSSTGTGNTPVIKANKIPYNYITCSQAESLAETFAPSGCTSSLLFGVQWDLVLKYLETKGISQMDLEIYSTNWGNYYDASFKVTNTNAKYSNNSGTSWANISEAGYKKTEGSFILLTTGADVRNSKMNIYDLAGNVFEWTLEYSSDSSRPCTFRGGSCDTNGSYDPASYRNKNYTTDSSHNMGARVSLY